MLVLINYSPHDLLDVGPQPDEPSLAQIKESSGTISISYNVTSSGFTAPLRDMTSGDYSLTVQNLGNKSVIANYGFLVFPLEKETAWEYALIFFGFILIVAGIIILAIGLYKVFRIKVKS